MKGRTEEHCRKIGLAHKGKSISDEHKRILSEVNTGKVMSSESRKKISLALKGLKHKEPSPLKGKTRDRGISGKMSETCAMKRAIKQYVKNIMLIKGLMGFVETQGVLA